MLSAAATHPRLPVRLAQQLGLGFAFWLVFLLVLQSGNAARSATMAFGEESLRILATSALASLTAPFLFRLSARFPLCGPGWGLYLAGSLAAATSIATALVVIAWAAAPLVLSPDNPRLSAPLSVQFAADAPLLTFAILAFVVLLQALMPPAQSEAPEAKAFLVRSRQGLLRIEAAEIDWVEAQENYVALRCGAQTHLLRDTLTAFAARLDPANFVRIHRRTLVNLVRVRALRALPGGDAMAVIEDGTELRVSRTYAARVRETMGRMGRC